MKLPREDYKCPTCRARPPFGGNNPYTGRAMGLHLTGMFKPCEDCALGNATNSEVSKKF